MLTRSFDEVYPQELLDRREAKLRKFWAGEGPRALLSINNGTYGYRQIGDDDTIVEHAALQMLTSADLSEDYLPWFGPDFGTISTAMAWGGEVIHPEGGNVFIKPVIHCPDDVDRLTQAAPDCCHVARAITLTKRLEERLGSTRFWRRAIDIQGPLSTVSLLWDQEDFFCSMIEAPDAVHCMLDRVTDHLIGMYRAIMEGMGPLCGGCWPYIWLPTEMGVVFTEDMMPLMSPGLYKEFAIPYIKRMADAFGGVFIHCCGEFEQHLENLVDSGINFLGFDYAEPHTRTEAIYEAFGPGLVYYPAVSSQGEAKWGSHPAYAEYLHKVTPDDMRLWFCLDTSWEGSAEWANTIRRLFM